MLIRLVFLLRALLRLLELVLTLILLTFGDRKFPIVGECYFV